MQKTALGIKGEISNRLFDSGFPVTPRDLFCQWGRSHNGAVVRLESSQTLNCEHPASHTCRRETVQDLSCDKSGQWPVKTGRPLTRWVALNRSNPDDLHPLSRRDFSNGNQPRFSPA